MYNIIAVILGRIRNRSAYRGICCKIIEHNSFQAAFRKQFIGLGANVASPPDDEKILF